MKSQVWTNIPVPRTGSFALLLPHAGISNIVGLTLEACSITSWGNKNSHGPKRLQAGMCHTAKNQGPRSSRSRTPASSIHFRILGSQGPMSGTQFRILGSQGPMTSINFRIRNPQDPMTSRHALQDTVFPRSHEFMAYLLKLSTFNLSTKAYHLQPLTTTYNLPPAGWVR